jgi:tRNA dimethylallyltransferase
MADAEAIAITGPTATGKTALAIAVARTVGGEVISVDSRQVYRGMDIGTAKPPPAGRGGVPHHGFDLVDPHERYSAGAFSRDARAWMRAIRQHGRVPVLAGGTGFFLKALTDPMFEEPALDAVRRERLKHRIAGMADEAIVRWAQALEPASLRRGGGRQRLARAIEIALLTGRTLEWWHRHAPPVAPPVAMMIFVLELPRRELYRRIDARVGAMQAAGLEAEVRDLVAKGYSARDPGMNATGYIELLPAVAGARSIEDALDDVRRATRRYARRQLTWCRNQLPHARRLDATRPIDELAGAVARTWSEERTA